MNEFYVGFDLGSDRDCAALAILEWAETEGSWDPVFRRPRTVAEQRVRFLERFSPHNSRPETAKRVAEVIESLQLLGRCQLIVDARGDEQAMVDLLKLAGVTCPIRPVERDSSGHRRPTNWVLLAGLEKKMLSDRTLKIATELELAPALLKEISEMRPDGTRETLVFALALAGYGAEKWCSLEFFRGQALV